MKIIVGFIISLVMISVFSSAYAAPLSNFVKSDCRYVGEAKAYIEGQARAINGAVPENSTPDQIRYFAEKSFNLPFSDGNLAESYLHLKYFIIETCGDSLPESAKLNPAAQQGVDLFYQMTAEVGHPVPEFGSIAMLILVASIIGVIASARKIRF